MPNPITMGYEGQVMVGPAGVTATNQLLNTRDMKTTHDPEYGETTVRGNGSAPPMHAEALSAIKWSMTLTMLNNTSDTLLTTYLLAAAAGNSVSGGPPGVIALRTKNNSAGKGYDGDVNVKVEQGAPLKGEATLDFAFSTNNNLRAASLYV